MSFGPPSRELVEVLERSRGWGFLGPGPIEDHIDHTHELLAALAPTLAAEAEIIDLGSGGGVPGLVAASALPHTSWVLLDAHQRRTEFLGWAVQQLGLEGRVIVVRARAEDVGRDPERRGRADAVVARSFGPPAVTAECAAPLLRVGGVMAVSEPPEPDPGRWSAEGLAALGFSPSPLSDRPWVMYRLDTPVPDTYPRRSGRPAKRPLW